MSWCVSWEHTKTKRKENGLGVRSFASLRMTVILVAFLTGMPDQVRHPGKDMPHESIDNMAPMEYQDMRKEKNIV